MGKEIEMARNNKTIDRIQAVWNKLGGEDGVDRLLRGELTLVVRSWREEDGIIRFSVTSDGTTGPGWVERLEQDGYNLGGYAKQLLLSPDFKPTNGVVTEIAVMKGSLFSNNNRTTRNILAEASRRKYVALNPEVACLIRVMFSDKEIEDMSLWGIVTMHEPIKDSGGDPGLLCVFRDDEGRGLGTCYDNHDYEWDDDGGFAFAVLAS